MEHDAPCFLMKHELSGTSRVVQWLRLCAQNVGGPGLIPGQGTRSHMLQLNILHTTTTIEDPKCHS